MPSVGQKECSNSPLHPGKVQIPTPWKNFRGKYPPLLRAQRMIKCPRTRSIFMHGKMLKVWIDRRIIYATLSISFISHSFHLYLDFILRTHKITSCPPFYRCTVDIMSSRKWISLQHATKFNFLAKYLEDNASLKSNVRYTN